MIVVACPWTRQFDAVEPENRLVASEPEARRAGLNEIIIHSADNPPEHHLHLQRAGGVHTQLRVVVTRSFWPLPSRTGISPRPGSQPRTAQQREERLRQLHVNRKENAGFNGVRAAMGLVEQLS